MKERLSNFEALRLLSMFTIVFYHLIDKANAMIGNSTMLHVLFNITHWGVPIFILISGYFFVNITLKKLVSFYLQCVFWLLFSYFVSVGLCLSSFDLKSLFHCFFPFSCSNLWFIRYYFFLMLVSPIINLGIKHTDNRSLYMINIGLLCSVLYFSLIWNSEVIAAGKSLYYFIIIYVTGASIRRLVDANKLLNVKVLRFVNIGGGCPKTR